MQEVILLKGIPASGKSTWAKQFMLNTPGYKRINKDDLRSMLDNSVYSRVNESFILIARNELLYKALALGLNVIVDDTNLELFHEHDIKNIIQEYADTYGTSVLFKIKWFHILLDEAIMYDEYRHADGLRSVGKNVIQSMYNKYLNMDVNLKEDSEVLIVTEITKQQECYPNLKQAIIVDIDGTLAIRRNRGPFEYDKVLDDLPNRPIVELVKRYQLTHQIIFISGRDISCYEDTRTWLQVYFGHDIVLYMRANLDKRKDALVKEELYNKYVKDNYCVDFVLDDRDQVVSIWRNKLHLTCLQVAPGNF